MSHWVLCFRCRGKIVACTCDIGQHHPVYTGEPKKVQARICQSCASKEKA